MLDICALIYQLTASAAQNCTMTESFRLGKLKVSENQTRLPLLPNLNRTSEENEEKIKKENEVSFLE